MSAPAADRWTPRRGDRAAEVDSKLQSVRALMARRDLDAVVLRLPANHAWLSAGGRSDIVDITVPGIADVVVTHDEVVLVTHNNEIDRLLEEEFPALRPRSVVLPWTADRTQHVPAGDRTAWDTRDRPEGTGCIAEDLVALRQVLGAPERRRAEELGREVAEAFTDAAVGTNPAMTEYEAMGRVAANLLARGIEPVVLLAAGHQRGPRHRHPLPTLAPLGALAMLVTCARRDGLVLSATRFVAHAPLDARMLDVQDRLLAVVTAFDLASRPGVTLGEAFRTGIAAYREHGFPEDEWTLHHQGGTAGYLPREEVATAASSTLLDGGQMMAWNPTVPGLKSEDTVLVTEEGAVVLTHDPRWPSTDVRGLTRPLVLDLT